MTLNRWQDFASHRKFRLSRFFVAGFVSFLADLSVFQIVIHLSGRVSLSFAMAGLAGTLASFVLSRYFVFRESRQNRLQGQVVRFGAVVFLILSVNFVLGLVIDRFSSDWEIVPLLALRACILVGFFFLKYVLLLVAKFR